MQQTVTIARLIKNLTCVRVSGNRRSAVGVSTRREGWLRALKSIGWTKDRRTRLRQAVVATLCQSNAFATDRPLRQFSQKDWQDNYRWLDASGVALYFYDALISRSLESLVPSKVLERFHKNQSDNRERTKATFADAVQVNEAFRNQGLQYLNLKGFTLYPDFCPDPCLRNQFDLDFLMPLREAPRCRNILAKIGYTVTGGSELLLEFKAGEDRPPSIADLYRPRTQRCLEVHFVTGEQRQDKYNLSETSFTNPCLRSWNGYQFASLQSAELFLAQALHLFWHLQSEWTRLSWLFEFRNAVLAHYSDSAFWIKVRNHTRHRMLAETAIATALAFAVNLFGDFAPRDVTEWVTEILPQRAQIWIEKYGNQLLLADFPGSKLSLMLQEELGLGSKEERRRKLFPLHRPPTVAKATRRITSLSTNIGYWSFRTRFHLVETTRYMTEARRWRKFVRKVKQKVEGKSSKAGLHTACVQQDI